MVSEVTSTRFIGPDAAYRLLQHDTTREHDSQPIDPRPSGVACFCAPFAFAATSHS
jgi:hypothetical protein